jgi:tRNA modification GTPase
VLSTTDTIVAAATPPGRSALAVVRLSGGSAIAIADRFFRGGVRLTDVRRHTVHIGRVVGADGVAIDEVVAAVYHAPHSYTGENVVEVSCHGAPIIVGQIVDLYRSAGARTAGPGEFTRRAFLSGKLDLAQAEAVAALIEARSRAAARAAVRQLGGGLSEEVAEIRRGLLDELARYEAHIDFPEDDLPAADHERACLAASNLTRRLRDLGERVRRSRPVWQATTVVLAGVPNVGKSSLFNALIGRERAIVHEDPGTTRDVVDAELTMGALPIRLLDTAGLTTTRASVEAEGVRRGRSELAQADRVVVVVDASQPSLRPEEIEILSGLHPERAVVAANKSDLGGVLEVASAWAGHRVDVSARDRSGLAELEHWIEASITGGPIDASDLLVLGARQEEALQRAAESAENAFQLLTRSAEASELVAEEWRASLRALGTITGESLELDLLDTIFSSFCIGK